MCSQVALTTITAKISMVIHFVRTAATFAIQKQQVNDPKTAIGILSRERFLLRLELFANTLNLKQVTDEDDDGPWVCCFERHVR